MPDDSLGGVTLVLGADWGVGDLRTVVVKRASGDASAPGTTGESPDGTGSGGTSTADKATCAS